MNSPYYPNRTAVVRNAFNDHNSGCVIYVRGPRNIMGEPGEVSYVATGFYLDKRQKRTVLRKLSRLADVIDVYVTSRGNIKVTFDTRANGSYA
jgi:hypothetical protein